MYPALHSAAMMIDHERITVKGELDHWIPMIKHRIKRFQNTLMDVAKHTNGRASNA